MEWKKGRDLDWREHEGRLVVESNDGSPYAADMTTHEVEKNSVGNVLLSEKDRPYDQPYPDNYYIVLPPVPKDAAQ